MGMETQARRGALRREPAKHGIAGVEWCGETRKVLARIGLDTQAWQELAGRGKERRGAARKRRQGEDRLDTARIRRQGEVGFG